MRHYLSFLDMSRKETEEVLQLAEKVKKQPQKFSSALEGKILFMLFQAPSLRTRLSFEAGMMQLGGHAIYYDIRESTIGKKETVADMAKVVSRYCNILMARLHEHLQLVELAANASVPVINGLTSLEHPCQVLSDIFTILEKKKTLKSKLAYIGDSNNNTTHSLLYAAAMFGMHMAVACPKGGEFEPQKAVLEKAAALAKSGAKIEVFYDAADAAKGADIIYTDSWMSYRVPPEQEPRRIKIFAPYQVSKKIMELAKPSALFMHCLPAKRGQEVTSDVIDGKNSVVYEQAENRLHVQKALMLWLFTHQK